MTTIDRTRPRVLIAEDDPTTLLLIRRTIEKWGYRAMVARDGEAALKIIEEQAVRLVLSDWEMPGLDGPELCQRLRSGSAEGYVYVIIVTSRQCRDSVVQGLESGADDFLSKPINPEELRARMAVGERVLRLEDDLQRKSQELKQANQRLAELAATDHLTGLGNRRSFEKAMARMHSMAQRQGVAYGVLMTDVDQFKQYNDHYGHQAGDRVLARLADALHRSIRAGDELFRYGGEELVLTTPFHDASTLRQMAERLRAVVEQCDIEHAPSKHGKVTVSIGGALFQPGAECPNEVPWSCVVERADQALYRAKDGGRNRVEISAPPAAESPGSAARQSADPPPAPRGPSRPATLAR